MEEQDFSNEKYFNQEEAETNNYESPEEEVKIFHKNVNVKNDQPATRSAAFLDISWASIVKIAFAVSIIYLIYSIGDILVGLLFALIISILFNPAINFLQKFKIPRIISAVFIYLIIFIVLGVLIYTMAPLLFSEIQDFSEKLPEYFDQAAPYLSGLKIEALEDFEKFSKSAEAILSQASTNIFSAVGAFFGGIFSAFVIFSLAFFISLEEDGLKRAIALVSPKNYKEKVLEVWKKTQKNIAIWFGIRIICCIFIGLAAGITCYVLDIRYAVAFGIFAGITNLIVLLVRWPNLLDEGQRKHKRLARIFEQFQPLFEK